jgi:phenylacetic acid degradation operon negative regulatory protein
MLRSLVAQCWELETIADSYRQFLATFAGLRQAMKDGFKPQALPALLARLMLIHDYRRIILRDPMLPPRLLPGDWIGREAYTTARAIYRGLLPQSERWIDNHLHAASGPLPPPDPGFRARFP